MNFKIIFIPLILIFAVMANAKIKQSSLLKEVEEHYRAAHTIKMTVNKIIKLKLLQKEKQSDGVISIKRGGKLRWETQSPEHSMVLADGKFIWLVDYPAEQDEKVHIIKATNPRKSQPHAIVAFLLGQGRISDDFAVISETPEEAGVSKLDLQPRENIDQVQWLTLFINKDDRSITKLNFEDSIGNITELSFKDIQFDKELDKKTFSFKPPKGAELTVLN